MTTRKELVEALRLRYRGAAFSDRIKILDEFVALTCYHRKHAIRVLRGQFSPATDVRLRNRVYDEAVAQALTVLWEAADRVDVPRVPEVRPLQAHTSFGKDCVRAWSPRPMRPEVGSPWHLKIARHTRYRILYSSYMKTTLDINDQLLADAKALAAQQRTSLTRLIEEGLQLRLRAQATGRARGRVVLPVFKGRGGLVSGVDSRSNKALLEALGDDA